MSSSPGIFDQEVVARPCRSTCRAHDHAQDLPSAVDPRNNDLGGGRPSGWTAQGRRPVGPDRDAGLWFLCNACDATVSEYDVEEHRCAP